MKRARMRTLEEVLRFLSSHSPEGWLYLPKDGQWGLKSSAAILVSDEVPPELEEDPDAGIPKFAKIHQLQQVFEVGTVQDIIFNARAQKPNVTLDDIFQALKFYYDHDSFMELSKDK
jgi:hypothetical protein